MWALAAAFLLAIAVWPIPGGMVLANDDLKFVRGVEYSGTFTQDVHHGWAHAANFRPLENFAALLCDAETLECSSVPIIQWAGLLALVAGVIGLARVIFPKSRAAAPLMLIWLALSPATTVSVWQMDTCSQTWSAALGIWCGLLTYAAINVNAGVGVWVLLVLVVAAGVNVKETFYGWSAGIFASLIVFAMWQRARDRKRAKRAIVALLPVAVLPAVHLLYRLQFGGLGRAANVSGDIEARYEIILGGNLLRNAWLAVLGVFSNGPVHLINDVAAPLALRVLPLGTLGAVFIVLAGGAALVVLHRDQSSSRRASLVLLASGAMLLSLSVTLPMGSVSELYGMGANVGSGLLLTGGLLRLWHADQDEQVVCRLLVAGCAAVILLAGTYGLISRARHFQLTWKYARELNHVVMAHQQALAPDGRAGVVYFGRGCTMAAVHNQYVISPVQALGLEDTLDWLNRRDPGRRLVFALDRPLGNPHERDLLLDCSTLPPRGHW